MVERRRERRRKRAIPDMPPLPIVAHGLAGLPDDTVVPADDMVLQLVRAMTTLTTEYQRLTMKLKEQIEQQPPAAAPPAQRPPPPPRSQPRPFGAADRVPEALPEAATSAPVAMMQVAVATRAKEDANARLKAAEDRAREIEQLQTKNQSQLGAYKTKLDKTAPAQRAPVFNAINNMLKYGGELNKQLKGAVSSVAKNKKLRQTAQYVVDRAKDMLTPEQTEEAERQALALPPSASKAVSNEPGLLQTLSKMGSIIAEKAGPALSKVGTLIAETAAAAVAPAPEEEADAGRRKIAPGMAERVSEKFDIVTLPPGNTEEGLRSRFLYKQISLPKACAVLTDAQTCNESNVCRMDNQKCVIQTDEELSKQGVPVSQADLTAKVMQLHREQLEKVKNKKQLCSVTTREQCPSLPDGPCVWVEKDNKCKQIADKDLQQNGWPTTTQDLNAIEADLTVPSADSVPIALVVAPPLVQLQEADNVLRAATEAAETAGTAEEKMAAKAQVVEAQKEVLAKAEDALEKSEAAPLATAQAVAQAAATVAAVKVPEPGAAVPPAGTDAQAMLDYFAMLDQQLSAEQKDHVSQLTKEMIRSMVQFATLRNEFARPIEEIQVARDVATPGTPEHTKLSKYYDRRVMLQQGRETDMALWKQQIEQLNKDLFELTSAYPAYLQGQLDKTAKELADLEKELENDPALRYDEETTKKYEDLKAMQKRQEPVRQQLRDLAQIEAKQKGFKGDIDMLKTNFDNYKVCNDAVKELQSETKPLREKAQAAAEEYKRCNAPCEEAAKRSTASTIKAKLAGVKSRTLGRTLEAVGIEDTAELKEYRAYVSQCKTIQEQQTCKPLEDARNLAQAKVAAKSQEAQAKDKECGTFKAQYDTYYNLFTRDIAAQNILERIEEVKFSLAQAEQDPMCNVDEDFANNCEIIDHWKKQFDKGNIGRDVYNQKVAENPVSPEDGVKFVQFKNSVTTLTEMMQGIILEAQGKAQVEQEKQEDANDPDIASSDELLASTSDRINDVVQRIQTTRAEAAKVGIPPPPAATATSAQQGRSTWEELVKRRRDVAKVVLTTEKTVQQVEEMRKFDASLLQDLKNDREQCKLFNYPSARKTMVECLARDPYCSLSLSNTCVPADAATLTSLGVPKTMAEYEEMMRETRLTDQRAIELVARLKHDEVLQSRLKAAEIAEKGTLATLKSDVYESAPESVKKLATYAQTAWSYAQSGTKTGWDIIKRIASPIDVAFTRFAPSVWPWFKNMVVVAGLVGVLPMIAGTPIISSVITLIFRATAPGFVTKIVDHMLEDWTVSYIDPLTKTIVTQGTGAIGWLPNMFGLGKAAETASQAIFSPAGFFFMMGLSAVAVMAAMRRKASFGKKAYETAQMRAAQVAAPKA